jgi:hypothetical protein
MMDQEFDKIEGAINMVEIITTTTREHIGKVEPFIRTIKEQSQALVLDLPFKILPRQVVIHLSIELDQPHYHHIVEVTEASKDERIYAAAHNDSLDNLPCNIPGVATTVNEIQIDDWIEIMQDYKDPDHDLPTHQTINVPPALKDATEPTNEPTDMVTPVTDNDTLSSILINGLHQSIQTSANLVSSCVGQKVPKTVDLVLL